MKFLKGPKKAVEEDDEELLQSYRDSGNLAVLARLYERYMSLVYGVCLKYLKDEELSKDAVMQIFEQLLVKVNRYQIKQFKSWLYTLSRNFCLMQLRADKKWEQESLDEVMELAVDLHPEYEDLQDDLLALERCKNKLPPAQKVTINMFYIDEKCYKEIADNTGYTLNEVKSYIQNGKRNLKICLEKNREH
ncbi:RNA polymerase sigma-70 factor (ECF subfamily) [Mucilaginibacter gracilis]|uniref:RNA polymerase sigma-70 factor (ECF subfamily) n=1 Tax=Mucilaginibacter gracilis TaxID=423350 RepID=A0A495IZE2_9SPHI|nr:sigma-70 family RNA polymerase sigma factor [Mucilaginibacter gracilis]RKR81468.1 RNA polymerase sigma-70 factor (ECF subfamily) [Mucilaginibacter gracilis]